MDHKAVAAEWGRILDEFFDSRAGAYARAVAAAAAALRGGEKSWPSETAGAPPKPSISSPSSSTNS